MPAAPLTQEQSSVVAGAAQLLQQGRAGEAATAVAPMISAGCRHPDPLMIYATACERLGRLSEALGACQAAVQESPERADLWAALGRMLYEHGNAGKGVELLERAVALDSRNADYWYNLGLAAHDAALPDRAIEALTRATELKPGWAMAWGGLGYAQAQSGRPEDAEENLRRALKLDPVLKTARHALTIALRKLGKGDEALEVSAPATAAETRLVRAHILADLGSDEAADAYRGLLKERPDLLDGHETYARLMPQLGRKADALDTYHEALRRAPTAELYLSALGSARDVGDSAVLRDWAQAARALYGDRPEYSAFEGLAFLQEGATEQALAILEPLAAQGFGEVLGHCADARLRLGDLDRAEAHALAATARDFTDQSAWAYLSLIWRLKDDPREQWLADYDRFVMPIMLDPPEGFADIDSFMSDLARELHRLHSTTEHPTEQSLRHGTQTRGLLFNRRSPLIQALASGIERQVQERIAGLPQDPTHPFLSRNTGRTAFKGSWSVRLRSSGFHVGHIHHEGWLSSALYVELPEGMHQEQPGTPTPGALLFGVPHAQFNVELAPRGIEQPQVGRLVIFPSYFWHGTVPFESEGHRMTVAFDMVPA